MGQKREGYKDVFSTSKTLIVGALSFVAAMAWRDFIKKSFEIGFGKRVSIKAYAMYALLTTLVAILVIYFLYQIL